MHTAKVSNHRLGTGLDGVFTGDIERVGPGRAAGRYDLRGDGFELLDISRCQRDGRAMFGELQCAGAANTLRSTCYKCDFSD
jgi:hypothetical protein